METEFVMLSRKRSIPTLGGKARPFADAQGDRFLLRLPVAPYPQPVGRSYWVYILTNRPNGTLYIGVTNNLTRRVWEHRQKTVPGFTQKYNLTRRVYFEETTDIRSAIAREKQLKGWLRVRKVELIEGTNPQWRDLYGELTVWGSLAAFRVAEDASPTPKHSGQPPSPES
ncbi:excinuclease ABC C subunit domain protein [Deinococcus aerius]|uniref:Excinuclease ABC C subunit domain protein n=1 Tax=Deinococcus aerius TaxID=200253 RepID=A0A2I9CYN7_9DEIO|nr:excinuclease ABC C subunit domain protein [Deinococcus aerius]